MDITYAFGTGDGELTEWVSPAGLDADGDGAVDAVLLDFDGDGVIDDAMWDADGDGAADTVRLDTTAEADAEERWFVDGAGDGTWAVEVPVQGGAVGGGAVDSGASSAQPIDQEAGSPVPTPLEPAGEHARAPGTAASAPPSPDGAASVTVEDAGRYALVVDEDGDGTADTRLADTDGDGYLDSARPSRAAGADPADAGPPAAESSSAAGVILGSMAGLGRVGPWGAAVP